MKKIILQLIEQRNKVFEGDTVEVLRPEGDNVLMYIK